MAILLLDDNGKPIPQYKNAAGDAFEALRGANGGMDVNVLNPLEEVPAGENIIGKVRNIDSNGVPKDISSVIKAILTFTPDSPTTLWEPAEGKKIVLKGMIVQSRVLLEGSVEDGPSPNDVIEVGVFTGMTEAPVGMFVMSAKQFLEGGPYGTPSEIVGSYERAFCNYGDGFVLEEDDSLVALSNRADVWIVAWGYEV